jgi:hypothetical protein
MKSFTSTCFRTRIFILAVICLQILIFCPCAQASFSGHATNFNWDNGYSAHGRFTAPILSGQDTLVFGVEGFTTESIDGEANSISDTLVFELTALNDHSFDGITIAESGDYGIDADNGGLVGVSGTVSIDNLGGSGSQYGNLTNDLQTMPQIYVEDGTAWHAWTEVGIGPSDWTHIRITLTNNLWAETSGGGSTAWIAKKGLGTTIAIQLIPEPATIGLLMLGSLVFLGKKK